MKLTLKLGLALGLLVMAGVVAAVVTSRVGSSPVEAPTPTPGLTARGNYERYAYVVSDVGGGNKKLAQFDPSLPTDEAVVLGALREVAQNSLDITIPPEVQPAVENRAEVNYVTFTVEDKRIWFELFRNSHGQVGTARFWTEPV